MRFANNWASLQMPQNAVEGAVRYFKEWVNATNRTFPAVLQEEAYKRDSEERERIRKTAVAEEQRLGVLKRARQALES